MCYQKVYSKCYLIVPLVLRGQILRLLESAEQILQPGEGPPLVGRHLVRLLRRATAVVARVVVLGVVAAARAAVEAVGVGGRLAVAKVAGVAATADAARHARLLNGLADHDAVLLELLGENGVEEGVEAAVQRQDKYREHLGATQF